jgi:hypothetical protein
MKDSFYSAISVASTNLRFFTSQVAAASDELVYLKAMTA